MSDSEDDEDNKRDEVLKRMLGTPPQPKTKEPPPTKGEGEAEDRRENG